MSSLKYIFLIIALVTVIRAQEKDDMDLEAVEDLPSEALNDEPISDEVSVEPNEESTESYSKAANSEEDKLESISDVSKTNEGTTGSTSSITDAKEAKSESSPDTSDPNEGIAKSTAKMSESTEEPMAIIFEEIEDRLMSPQLEGSTQPSVIQASTDANDSITSEYNGIDADKSESMFSCYGRAFGQYADVQRDCRVFHLCYPYFNSTTDELLYQRISFLCDNSSVFDQKRFICVDNSTVEHKCSDSKGLYLQTNQEYLIRVFSQSVSPNDEVKGQPNRESNRNWMSWLSGH